jgi:hypothetical protein
VRNHDGEVAVHSDQMTIGIPPMRFSGFPRYPNELFADMIGRTWVSRAIAATGGSKDRWQ